MFILRCTTCRKRLELTESTNDLVGEVFWYEDKFVCPDRCSDGVFLQRTKRPQLFQNRKRWWQRLVGC